MSDAASTRTDQRQVLHVGCGTRGSMIDRYFDGWRQVRLDIDPDVDPDIVADMTDMAAVQTGSMDAVWSSHNVEHLRAHEVHKAFAEFHRVLKPGGMLAMLCPNLLRIAQLVAEDRLEDPIYTSPAGPVTPLDMIYGYGPSIARGKDFMAHRTGFTPRTLTSALTRAGFIDVSASSANDFDLFAKATKPA